MDVPPIQAPQSEIPNPPPPLAPPIDIPLAVLPEHDCSYLPGRAATSRAFYTHQIAPELYHHFMDAGFRRSGKVIYQPVCAGCRLCVPIRVRAEDFRPNKSQRRCLRKNADLVVERGRPTPTDEKFDLYRRYIIDWHGTEPKRADDDRDSFEAFLYQSPVETMEFTYRSSAGKLVAVGICDMSRHALSSVYFYFDPAESGRGVGTFGILKELAFAQSARLPYYYLGYWVNGCGSMEYKVNFRPCELLTENGTWRVRD